MSNDQPYLSQLSFVSYRAYLFASQLFNAYNNLISLHLKHLS